MANRPATIDIHPGPGSRIRARIERPDRELISQLSEFPTADISDLLNRLYAVAADIRNVVNDEAIAGPACTVKLYPGDNLMLHKAIDVAQPGDVIVVDAAKNTRTGVLGDLVAAKLKHQGIRGVVVDGFVRDLAELRAVGLPVFARGVTPVGPLHRGPGELNFPIACDGIVVHPGDIVVADADGIAFIPRTFASELLQRLQRRRDKLETYVREVREGNFSNEWVDDALATSNCLVSEDD